jgi:hypothetical protein
LEAILYRLLGSGPVMQRTPLRHPVTRYEQPLLWINRLISLTIEW